MDARQTPQTAKNADKAINVRGEGGEKTGIHIYAYGHLKGDVSSNALSLGLPRVGSRLVVLVVFYKKRGVTPLEKYSCPSKLD